jgi:hypothetical protein
MLGNDGTVGENDGVVDGVMVADGSNVAEGSMVDVTGTSVVVGI